MSDTAKGPLAGYLFQFEKALLMLSNLEKGDDYISIEDVDDIATHKENGTVLLTIQAKNSISNSGTTFEDTSNALWRTLQIWIEKIEENIFNSNTKFICSTNKIIPKTSLLNKIKELSFDDLMIEVKNLLENQKAKIKGEKLEEAKGKSIKKTIKLIEFAISKEVYFEIIKRNIIIEDSECVKEKFFNNLHLSNSMFMESQKDSIFHSFYGWIVDNCNSKWKNGEEARISKDNFNEKHFQVFNNPSIVNAVFRTKELLGTIDDKTILNRRKDLFVRQIEDINRRIDAKERIIKSAILDFIYSDIELSYIVTKGHFTETDFDEFLKHCQESWQMCFDEYIVKEIDDYSDDEKNSLAVKIYDTIMNKIEIKFKTGYDFNPNNKYIRNGSFLKLSNYPIIGWHPEWEKKYK